MTILQKMLAVPLLSLVLYSAFILYSYNENQKSGEQIAEIRNDYMPLLEVANENIRLFDETRSVFKDAVLASESGWLRNAQDIQRTIIANIDGYSAFPHIIEKQQVETLKHSFNLYYINAQQLAENVIQNQQTMFHADELIQNVENYHNDSVAQFSDLKKSIQKRFRQSVDDTSDGMKRLQFVGSSMSIALLVFLFTVTFIVSISVHRSVSQVIERMKLLAEGGADFSQRLERQQKDELGYLIFWFNKLADKLEQSYSDLETISITDKLTQLNNRNRADVFFTEAIIKAKASRQSLAVIILDIDHFKVVNDKFGHPVGDAVLQEFAQILKESAREHDFVGRWGGEEFILIIQNVELDNLIQFAELVRVNIESHVFETVGKVTASIGVATFSKLDDQDSLVKRADEGLYKAKSQGRNCVVMQDI